jgi:uncharacterized protein
MATKATKTTKEKVEKSATKEKAAKVEPKKKSATKAKATAKTKELSVEDKLRALYQLQWVDSEMDKIRTLRGELPLEVQDLEDEIIGLETRLSKLGVEADELEKMIANRKNEILESEALIKKYKEQQEQVRNNREFDALSKEIEYQELEIQLSEKKIREFTGEFEAKKEVIETSKSKINERKSDLQEKEKELDAIVAETQRDEDVMLKKAKKVEDTIEERLIIAYKKIRKNARNSVAVAPIMRDACGGCFNKIPPQRHLDVRSRRKIIVCEYCGRILVDSDMVEEIDVQMKKKK